jgi:hypothetical protein
MQQAAVCAVLPGHNLRLLPFVQLETLFSALACYAML